nr:Uncharacterised protein [Salmonella enterica subsp. enterica serovar Typhi]
MHSHFFLIFQQRRQLVIKEQTVTESGFGVLRGVGANEGVQATTLFVSKLNFGKQYIKRATGARWPFVNRTADIRPAFAVQNTR